jgi:hypothetical protein
MTILIKLLAVIAMVATSTAAHANQIKLVCASDSEGVLDFTFDEEQNSVKFMGQESPARFDDDSIFFKFGGNDAHISRNSGALVISIKSRIYHYTCKPAKRQF